MAFVGYKGDDPGFMLRLQLTTDDKANYQRRCQLFVQPETIQATEQHSSAPASRYHSPDALILSWHPRAYIYIRAHVVCVCAFTEGGRAA